MACGTWPIPALADAHVYAVLLALVLHPFPLTCSSLPRPSFSTSRLLCAPPPVALSSRRCLVPSLSRSSPSQPPPFAPSSFAPFLPFGRVESRRRLTRATDQRMMALRMYSSYIESGETNQERV